jgi:hypothetical protein
MLSIIVDTIDKCFFSIVLYHHVPEFFPPVVCLLLIVHLSFNLSMSLRLNVLANAIHHIVSK